MQQKITTFLTYKEKADEAAEFYTSIFKNSKITKTVKDPRNGSVLTVEFELDGEHYVALNGGPDFNFTHGFSLMVSCDTQEEIDYFWEKLTEGGKEVACGWLTDKYGVSWQIAPPQLIKLLGDSDKEKARRAMEAMMKMVKINLKEIEDAAEGKA